MARRAAADRGQKQGDVAETIDRAPLAPLPPPKQNKPLLIVAAALVAGWTAFLLWMALR